MIDTLMSVLLYRPLASHRVCEAVRRGIRVDSRIGGGTVYTLFLPRSHGSGGEAYPGVERGPTNAEGVCVLVV